MVLNSKPDLPQLGSPHSIWGLPELRWSAVSLIPPDEINNNDKPPRAPPAAAAPGCALLCC